MNVLRSSKRRFTLFLGTLTFSAIFAPRRAHGDTDLESRFAGIRGVVVTNSLEKGSTPKRFVTAISETGTQLFAPAVISERSRDTLSYTGGTLPVPREVRITWREDADVQRVLYGEGEGWIGGRIAGDYTVEVANRIPSEVLDYVRSGRGRSLRLKFRLKDDGVLFAWDVQERYTTQYGSGLRYKLPGGDFLDIH
jgi:hypothetical protein